MTIYQFYQFGNWRCCRRRVIHLYTGKQGYQRWQFCSVNKLSLNQISFSRCVTTIQIWYFLCLLIYLGGIIIGSDTLTHFNMPGHSLADLRVNVIEQRRGKRIEYRKEREHYHIRKFDTYHQGINGQKWIVGWGSFSAMQPVVINYLINLANLQLLSVW